VVKEFSYKWNKTVVLKGANTIISTPDREAWVSEFANPALASAGTGDVLSGIIAGLLAQKLSIRDSAILGVYIHGLTGKMFKNKSGLMARDLLNHVPIVMDGLRNHKDF
jgi:NAD(P)H-hydrate epimerase